MQFTWLEGMAVKMRSGNGVEETRGLREYEPFLFGFSVDDHLNGYSVLLEL